MLFFSCAYLLNWARDSTYFPSPAASMEEMQQVLVGEIWGEFELFMNDLKA